MTSPRSAGRLPTFKGKRDLSLGAGTSAVAAAAKIAGKKPSVSEKTADKKKFVPNLNVSRRVTPASSSSTNDVKSGWGGEKKSKDFKDVRKPRPEFIQTVGSVFAEGFGSDGIRRRSAKFPSVSSGGNQLEKPKLNLDVTFDKEAEAKRLKELLRDDFIDDLSSGPLVPVQLPMIDTGTLFKEDPDVKEDKDEVKNDDKRDQIKFTDLIKMQKGDLFFLQLPDHLPGPVEEDVEKEEQKCQLKDLEEGYLGKVQVRKSGRTQVVMGEHRLDMDLGTQVGFLQDLVSVRVPEKEEEEGVPEMTVLGHVRHRVVLAPDWSRLFESAKVDGCSSSDDDDE